MAFLARLNHRVFVALAVFCSALATASVSAAAEIEAVRIDDETTAILLIGDIKPGDANTFRRIAAKHESAIVVLESGGGSTIEAIEIGKIIRVLDLPTLVMNGSQCDSACALIWLAGSPRSMSRSARVGFHASYLDQSGRKIESGVGNALVGRYLTQLDLPLSAVIFATKAPPESLLWLNAGNYANVGIETNIVDDLDSSNEEENTAGPADAPAPPPFYISPNPPSKKDTSYYGEAGDWAVMTDHTLAESCFAVRFYPDGTIVRLNNDARFSLSDGNGFLLITNPAWTSLTMGRDVPVTLRFGAFEPWDAVASVMALGGFNWLHITFAGEEGSTFKREFSAAPEMGVARDGREVARVDLTGSGEAVKTMNKCQAAANNGRVKADPFAG